MKNKNIRKKAIVITLILFFGVIFGTSVNGTKIVTNNIKTNNLGPTEVWVDDDYDSSTPGWGVDHFDNIQDGIDNVNDQGLVNVKEGNYAPFIIEGRNNLLINGENKPIITGNQIVKDYSYPADVNNVIFINNSELIIINGFEIIGTNPSDRHFTVFYQKSNGAIEDNEINANNIGNMNALAIRAITNSNLTVKNSIIKNYGRIAIYAKTGTTLIVNNCELIGHTYSAAGQVNYGIEIEGINEECIGEIKNNKIYNHDNTAGPQWSSAGILIDNWRYYGPSYNCKESKVLIENNDIYDNLHGIQMVPNDNIEVVYNKIFNNNYGAVSDPYFDGNTYIYTNLNAKNNWWGDPSGPYHPVSNPEGLGDQVDNYVLFTPWITNISANISCEGFLNWPNAKIGTVISGLFSIENTGFIYSELNWEITEWPLWGTFSFQPSSGLGLTPQMGKINIEVTITTPTEKNKEFSGKIKIINTENPSEFQEISVYLKTPRNKSSLSNKFGNLLTDNLLLLKILKKSII